ncbi:Carbohydrate-binding CenC domain protein [Beutenbergia cavernae DSM 12333]|uniref:Carbohydrate-binding CenC domain protein n=1 Tax=Beutenbergia cavernae (strain ATCC BAA-8 / DSM 12333 / CCUG 43141 / JCM 11478 / NBRC 16432 / NCIMB 13614 / HKI 0122) TaxID=471853 RepID=C5C1G8_BEUC1|nr:hypothetical protein [Beutenbergia cavernae]ACQ81578.1 Carbohydrate-binding CenC domain protein [Beutenbergia cavernae DSM 12333]
MNAGARTHRARTLRLLAGSFALTALAATTAFVPAVAGPPDGEVLHEGDVLVENHSFESGLDAWRVTDGRGGDADAGCGDAVTTSDEQAADGAASAVVSATPGCGRLGLLSSPVDVVAGETYSAFVDVRSGTQAQVALRWLSDDGDVVASVQPRPARHEGVVEVQGEAPDDAAALAVEVAVWPGRPGTETVVDNVLLTAPYTLLPNQVTKPATFLAAQAGVDENGRAVTFTVATGSAAEPAQLVVSDILTGEVTRTVPLPGATGSWTVSQHPTSGLVYIGTYQSAALWSWEPGSESATRIGTPPVPHLGMVYGLSFGADGTVYGGGWGEPTAGYEGAVLWSYDESAGFLGVHGDDPLTTDANYTRWTAYEETTDAVFTGTGTVPHLYGCDTGADAECVDLTQLLSPEILAEPWVYGGTASDGHVMVWAGDSNSLGNDWLVVLDVTRDAAGALQAEVSAEIPGVVFNGSSRVVDGKIYYTKAGDPESALHSYELATGQEERIAAAPTGIFSRSWEVVELDDPAWPGVTIVGQNSGAVLAMYNLETGNFRRGAVTGIPDVSIGINSVVGAPDGRIWTSGYLTGGLGTYSPMRGDRQTSYAVGGQAEGMLAHDGLVYQGIYPYGQIRAFDPLTQDGSSQPPTVCEIGEEQNRPYALHGVGDRLYYGSEATYGAHQGAFGWVDLATGECHTSRGIAGDRSVNTITSSAGLVFGGTSIFFSYDGTPTETEAVLLVVDEATGSSELVEWPVAGTRSINAAVTAPDGTVWFYAEGWLLAMDPHTREWLVQEEVFPDLKPGDRIPGNYASMILGGDGVVYGNAAGRVFAFDPAAALTDGPDVRVLLTGANAGIAADGYGNLYVPYASTRLVRIDPSAVG